MSEPIFDPAFWKERLLGALRHEEIRWAVFNACGDSWTAVNIKHRQILAEHVHPETSIVDIGCGWGRILRLMPSQWTGRYWGIDLSPDFLELAKRLYPDQVFIQHDLRQQLDPRQLVHLDTKPWVWRWDIAILCSIRDMVLRESPDDWPTIEANVRKLAKKILYLEYDINHPGVLE